MDSSKGTSKLGVGYLKILLFQVYFHVSGLRTLNMINFLASTLRREALFMLNQPSSVHHFYIIVI